MNYLRSAVGPVPQSEPLPGMVPNSAGGHAYAVDDWARLQRFLILGSEGGSYYASERKLTLQNVDAVRRCVALDGARVVNAVVDVSDAGRAPKNDPAILALALCAKTGDDATRAAAFAALPKVCRIGTHLYHFAAFVNELGGWGRGTKRAIGNWFNRLDAKDLAYQLVKYQSRDGWSSRDLLRLAHPTPRTVDHAALYAWACGHAEEGAPLPQLVESFERLKTATSKVDVIKEIVEHRLPREAIPTQWLTDPDVWGALVPGLGLTALIRNLATMTRVGYLTPGSPGAILMAERITNAEALRKSRVHPLAVLVALKTYQQGRSMKGDSTWNPITSITDALDAAFYASFGNVEPTGKRTVLALDCSASMTWQNIAGMPGITPRTAAVAMAMVTAAVEPKVTISGFCGEYVGLDVSPRRRLDDNCAAIDRLRAGSTDCSVPILHAEKSGGEVDTFVVYTDSETWAGREHPSAALKRYRRKVPGSKLAVVGMVSNGFTIADPTDPGMLDVVGFDTATPQVLSSFSKG